MPAMTEAPLSPNDRLVTATPAADTTVIDYDFEVTRTDALQVVRLRAGVRTVLQYGVDWIFDGGLGDETGGSIQLVVASLADDTYYLAGLHPHDRLSDFQAQKAFDTAKINADLDALTMQAQELRRDADRALKSEYGQAGLSIDTAAFSAGDTLMVGPDGTIIEGPDASEIQSAQGYAESADAARGYAAEWAIKPEDSLVSAAAGGNDTSDYSALHWAAKGAASAEAAAEAKVAAEAAAASLNLPAVEAGKGIRGNSGATGYDAFPIGDGGLEIAGAANRRAAMDLIVGESYYTLTSLGVANDFTGDASIIVNELLGDGVATGSGGDGTNALPVGSCLHIPMGTYRTLSPIVQKRWVNVIFDGDLNFQSTHVSAEPTWRIAIKSGLAGYSDAPRNMRFGFGGRIVNYAGGKEALVVDQGTGNLALFQLSIEHIRLRGYDPEDGSLAQPALRLTGYDSGAGANGPTFCHVRLCSLDGGVHLDGVADGNTVTDNMIFGANARGVILDLVAGAARTKIDQNAITTGQGSLEVIAGAQWDFTDNQCEQGAGATNTLLSLGGVTAMAIVRGADDGGGNPTVQSGVITGNNFGCGIGLVDMSFIVDWAEDVVIEDNTHFPGTLYIDGRLTANSRNCHVGFPRQLRQTRSTGNGYNAHADKKLRLQNFGSCNSGIIESLSSLGAMQNGFTNSSCYARRNRYGDVVFEGQITVGGSYTASILINTLPAGFRPHVTVQFAVPINGALGVLSINTSGELRLTTPPAGIGSGHVIYMGGIRYAAQGRAVYDGED